MPGAPDDQAVRIFIEFKRNETAVKGILSLCLCIQYSVPSIVGIDEHNLASKIT